MRLLLLIGGLIASSSALANGPVQALPNSDLDRIYKRTAPATTVTQARPAPGAAQAPSPSIQPPKVCGLLQQRGDNNPSEMWLITRTARHTLRQWKLNGYQPVTGRYHFNSASKDLKYRVEILYQGSKNWVWAQNGQEYPIGEIKNYWFTEGSNALYPIEQILIENHKGEFLLFYIELSRTLGLVKPTQLMVTDPCDIGINEFGNIAIVK